jgi:uncharacterized membrane protein YhhN
MDALTFGRLPHFDRLDRWLLLLSIASSAAYMATRAAQPFPGSVVLKALGMAPLAVLAWRVLRRAGRDRDAGILAAALGLSCLGDVFFHLGARRYFVHALAAFLLAHLAYVLLFTRSWPRPLRPSAGQLILAALVVIYGLVICASIWTALGRVLIPALAYACAITAMVISAILAGFARPYVVIGALLFLISDSLIAAGRFRMSAPLAALLIWPTYYLGQYGITVGFLRDKTLRG